jgi:hypothetical protein
MKYFSIFFLVAFLPACKQPRDKGINVTVTDGKDTLSHFHYEGDEQYEFYSAGEETNIFSDKKTFDKIPGQFRIGIKDLTSNPNRSFMCLKENTLGSPKGKTPFLCAELIEDGIEYGVELSKDYLDSTKTPITRFETYIAINKKTNDTILFQETNSFNNRSNLVTIVMIYTDIETKQEMISVLKDYSKTAKESYTEKK